MKSRDFLIITMVLVFILNTGVLMSLAQSTSDRDNYGKLVGWVVDPETGKPVNEVFSVYLFRTINRHTYRGYIGGYKSDGKGYLTLELPPQEYYLVFEPVAKKSKYSFESLLIGDGKNVVKVKIEKGKITEFRKVATIAGRIRVKMVALDGNIINPNLTFGEQAKIVVSIGSPNLFSTRTLGRMKEDGLIAYNIPPDTYTLEISFRGLGYADRNIENIKVESNRTSEVQFEVNPDDITGIEGRLLDTNGNPLMNSRVHLIQKFKIGGTFYSCTDKDGIYRITGLTPGLYSFLIFTEKKSHSLEIVVNIKRGVLMHKDLFVDE